MPEDVLVIGAGPAGIASAYYLEKAKISYKVVDQAAVIASTWANLYPSLRLNTTRFFSHLPDRRFPLSYGLFPTGKQYHRYLVKYAQAHGFNIHLGVTVRHACQEGDGWRVFTSEGSDWYRAVIAATGRFSRPCWPTIPGMDSFQGELIHAHDYHGPEPFTGKRVIVVGNGPSGVDISTELGRYAARPVLLSQRTGVVLRPRYPWGLPKHAWIMIAERLPGFVARPLLEKVSELKFEHLDRLGIKTPVTEAETSAAGATRGRELIDAVKAGRVRSVDGPARFEGHTVILKGGSRHEVDAVILATGYLPALFEYLDVDGETNASGWPLRVGESPDDITTGKREVQGYPGLYLVGVYYQGKGAMHNMPVEAEAAVEEIKQRLNSTLSHAVDA